MKLLDSLEQIRDTFCHEISIVHQFIEKIISVLLREKSKKLELSDEESSELNKVINFLSSPDFRKNISSYSIQSEKVINLIESVVLGSKYRELTAEMTLSYLISYLEAFIKEYLYTILVSRKAILKSDKPITYEKVCTFKSIKALIASIARKEVDTLSYGSIDDVSGYFEKKFKLDIKEFYAWQELREAAYRRNIIVHNSGVTNDVYCLKTHYKDKNVHLKTDIDYVNRISEILLEWIPTFHAQMKRKLKL